MAAGIGLHEVKLGSEESFNAFWEAATYFILFSCLDDSGKEQGLAAGAITSRYHPDADGAFLKLDYVAASDEYYAHWIVDQGGSAKWHQVCRRPLSGCKPKVGRDQVVVIQRMAWITHEDVEACLKQWKVKRLDRSVPGSRKKPVTLVEGGRTPRGAQAVLARCAQASAESTKKRKKDSEQDKAKKALKTLAQTKNRGLGQ